MSKAAKRSLLILVVLLLATLGFAAFSVLEKQKVEQESLRVQAELEEANKQFMQTEKKYIQGLKSVKEELTKAQKEQSKLENELKAMEVQAKEKIIALSNEVDMVVADRDKWKRRIETIRGERDKLMSRINGLTRQLEEKPEPQVVYKERKSVPVPDFQTAPRVLPGRQNEAYWSQILKQKASLEIDIEKFKEELSSKSIEIVELRQSNDSFRMEVDNLKHAGEEIDLEIQHKTDMIDNLSLELARTKNDKKFIADRVEKMKTENGGLRRQVKQLMTVKSALEKSLVRLNQEKDKVEGRLGKTETIIQSKIDEIWQIKDDLDRSIRESQGGVAPSGVELPPIIVSSNGKTMNYNTGTPTGFNGKVISVNESNNFVIVDIGENNGVRLGDLLSVYRDSKYIARLEVIQVRKDISAADLKDQWSKVKVGDIIR